MVRQTGQQGVPVIKVDDEFIVGFDQPRLERALAAAAKHRPAFGAAVANAAAHAGEGSAIPTSGAYVGRVRAGSPAQRAGLAPGDVILELNEHCIATAADLESRLRALGAGDAARVGFVRNGERRTGEAQL
jgi:S1-C subfamily serine protease